MSNPSRRTFVITVAGAGALAAATRASAQAAKPATPAAPAAKPATPAAPAAGPVLSETDPQAVALGYKSDTTKVDKAKYPQHTPAQMCNGCNFFQGKPTDATAPCQLFAGKHVANKGWCTAYAKKA